MAERPQKKKKQSYWDMCNITLEVLIQVAKIKRWLEKECSTEMHQLKSCLFKLTRTFFYLLHKQHLLCLSWLWYTEYSCTKQRFVRLLFDFTCNFVLMISVYFDVNSFKLFLYVSAYFCLPIGGGDSESSRCWRDSNKWGILGGNGETWKAEDTMFIFHR